MFKIKIHSVVDYITSSSTEVYSWYDSSISACKEMINEILKVFGITDKICDDIFYIDVFCDEYKYEESDNFPEDKDIKFVQETIKKVLRKEIDRPDWMETVDEGTNWDDMPNKNEFYIEAKSEEFSELANKIEKFLYSPSHDAIYNG